MIIVRKTCKNLTFKVNKYRLDVKFNDKIKIKKLLLFIIFLFLVALFDF